MDLHVRRGHIQRARKLAGELGGRCFRTVNETIATVAIPAQHFEQIVVIAFPANAEAIQGDALAPVDFDLLLERSGIGVAQVRRAVGRGGSEPGICRDYDTPYLKRT